MGAAPLQQAPLASRACAERVVMLFEARSGIPARLWPARLDGILTRPCPLFVIRGVCAGALPRLTSLSLNGNARMDDTGVIRITQSLRKRQRLDLGYLHLCTDRSTRALAALQDLEDLVLSGQRNVTDAGVKPLVGRSGPGARARSATAMSTSCPPSSTVRASTTPRLSATLTTSKRK